jgi:hypothetical protein
MKTRNSSLPAIILARLARGAVPIDGVNWVEPRVPADRCDEEDDHTQPRDIVRLAAFR